MKLSKIFVLASAVMAFTACSEEVEWNSTTTGVVSMKQETVSVKEAKGRFVVPIAVTGERNAPIQVTVEVKAADLNPAVEDKNYLITSKTINIAADAEMGEVEIFTVDDDEINEARQFTMTIISAKGATIDEAKKSTAVTLKDNDAVFYEKLAGNWTVSATSLMYGAPEAWDVTINTFEEGDPAYEQYAIITGISGYPFLTARLNYYYDAQTKSGYVAIAMPWVSAEGVSWGALVNFYLKGITPDFQIIEDECEIKGEWNEKVTEITFESTPYLGMPAYTPSGDLYDWWDIYQITKMVKK